MTQETQNIITQDMLFKTKKDFKAGLKGLVQQKIEFETAVQIAACSAIKLLAMHRNVNVVQNVVNDVLAVFEDGGHSSINLNSLKEFFVQFAMVSYDEEEKLFVFDKSKSNDLEGAMSKHWYKMRKQAEFTIFDPIALLDKQIKTMVKRIEDENKRPATAKKGEVITMADVEVMRIAYNKLVELHKQAA